ncbi:MAG TPA: hypothetical protein PLN21_21610 [Gemmatales bacterium]|nr:hypothetical protein [Gemmatales bacterium]
MRKLISLFTVALISAMMGCCHDTCDCCRDVCSTCGNNTTVHVPPAPAAAIKTMPAPAK